MPRDRQQALLLSILRSRSGEPVTYAELQDRGIEFPASLVSELELSDVEIERCHVMGSGGRSVPAVRLPAAVRRAQVAAQGVPTGESGQVSPAPRTSHRPRARILAPLALVVAVGVVTTAVVMGASGRSPHSRPSAQLREFRAGTHTGSAQSRHRTGSARSRETTAPAPRQTTTTTSGAPRLPATPVSPSQAAQLEAQGHGLLAAGQSSAAVPILERAVAFTGERVSACLEPTTNNCLTYAYALFDLGRALQLSGHAGPAVAVLKQRLRIDDQRPEVAAQLASAQQG